MDPVFSCFVFYGVLLVVKMYILAIITGQVRLRKKVSDSREVVLLQQQWEFAASLTPHCLFLQAFANPEDSLRHGGLQFHREDPYVERCRR